MTGRAAAKLISDREFAVEHTFRAPASRVFEALIDPRLVPRWWAPPGGSVRVDAMDVRPGGTWRYLQRSAQGRELVFSGSYLEVRPVSRLRYTFRIEGQPGSELTSTVELREDDGVTVLTQTNLLPSTEVRDAMVEHGAAAGARVAWTRLENALGGS